MLFPPVFGNLWRDFVFACNLAPIAEGQACSRSFSFMRALRRCSQAP